MECICKTIIGKVRICGRMKTAPIGQQVNPDCPIHGTTADINSSAEVRKKLQENMDTNIPGGSC